MTNQMKKNWVLSNGKKGMEQTYYAVVQAAQTAVSQGKLTSEDYKNLVNQMYQFNMANPVVGQIDNILADAAVAQRNPAGFTPKIEQPLVVQAKGYDLNSATKQAGIDPTKRTSPVVINIGIDGHAVAGNQGAGVQRGLYIIIPGQDGYGNAFGNGNLEIGQYGQTYNSLEQNQNDKPIGVDAGFSGVLGVSSANNFKGVSDNYAVGVGPYGGGASTNSNGELTGASISFGGESLPASVSKTTATTCTKPIGSSKWECE